MARHPLKVVGNKANPGGRKKKRAKMRKSRGGKSAGGRANTPKKGS